MATSLTKQMDNLFDAEGRRRRKDRPVVEEVRHPLESVRFFDRPMSASTRDPQVGTDDMGNPVFKTKLGAVCGAFLATIISFSSNSLSNFCLISLEIKISPVTFVCSVLE